MDREYVFEKIKVRRLAGLMILCMIIMLIACEVFKHMTGFNRNDVLYPEVIFLLCYMIAALWVWRKLSNRGISVKPYFFLNEEENCISFWKIALMTVVLLAFSLGAGIVTFVPLSHVAPDFVKSIIEERSIYTDVDSLLPTIANILKFIMVVVMAPVVEELVFRGVMLNRFMLRWSVKTSIIVSSILFGILHFDFIGAFVFGIGMSILYIKTKSLIAPVLCHALNNSLASGIGYISFFIEGKEEIQTIEMSRGDFWTGVILIAATTPFITIYLLRNWKSSEWEKTLRSMDVSDMQRDDKTECEAVLLQEIKQS